MALDLHLAKTIKEAPYKSASASFEAQLHELIFNRFGLPNNKYPLFKRMEDYYKDTKYSSREIELLVKEITEIKTMFSNNKQLTEQLNIILSACSNALQQGLSIWVYCD